jgi:hypothetical protein
MNKGSLPYTLYRIEDDSSLTPVSQHQNILTAIAAGGYAVEVEDFDFAYALYAGDPSNGSTTRVASFREGRIGYRLWATRTGRISPSVEDRYDHDVDELMAWSWPLQERIPTRSAPVRGASKDACTILGVVRGWLASDARVVGG